MQNSVKRFLALVLALVMVFGMMPQIVIGASAATFGGGEQLYLKPNSNWKIDNARFAIYVFNNSTNQDAWADMFDSDNDGIYEVTVPTGSWTNVIFCRMNPSATANNWNNKWNQTGDLENDGTNNLCTINDGRWDCGTNVTWSVYTPSDVPVVHTYTVAGVSALCGTEWDVANTANDMTDEDADGIYTKVYENVAAGAYEYKVAVDHSWNESYGNGTANATVTVAKGGSTVTITFNAETKAVNAEVEVPHEHSYLYDCSTECSTCTNGHREASHAFVAGVCTYGCGTADPDYVAPVTNVAQIGEQGYETLTEAIAAATAGDTIILLADITEDVTVDKNLTIDGAGKTYTGKMTVNTSLDVTVQNVNFVKGYIDEKSGNHGNLTVKKCTFDGGSSIGYAITINGGDTLTIEDTTAKNYSTGVVYVKSSMNIVSVKNVEISTVAAAFNIVYCNEGTFENVKVSNATYGLHSANYGDRTFTLTGCEFDCASPVYVQKKGEATVTVVFEGNNTFYNAVAYSSDYTTFVFTQDAVLTAPQVFNNALTTNVADHVVVYEEGTYKVAPVPKVAQIGETQYKTLAEAIAAANAGDTITLLADITEDVTVNKSLTIDGANFQYTGTITVTGSTVNVVIKNVNFVNGSAYAVKTNTIKSITVENCTVKGYTYGFLYANKSTPTIVVKDVVVEGGNYGFFWNYGTKATFENVSISGVTYGILTSNFGAKTITLKNCSIEAENGISVNEKSAAKTDTFKFEGVNKVSSLTTSSYAKIVAEAQSGEYIGDLVPVVGAVDADATVNLLSDVKLTEGVEINKNLTINLVGYTVESAGDAFVVTDGTLTLDGDGVVKAGTAGVGSWCAVWANGGNVVINGGTYSVGGDSETTDTTHQNDVIYTKNGGTVLINGGTFLNDGTVWTLNENDANRGTITVCGGTFENWNPENNVSEGPNTNFVAEGYEAVDNGDNTWTVQEKALFDIVSINVKAGESLDMYFYVQKADLDGTDYYAVVTKTFADGRANVVREIPFSEWESYNSSLYRFGFDDISAKEMTDEMYVTVYNGDGTAASNERVESIKSYAELAFEKINDTKLWTALIDMLNYGAAAQDFFEDYGINDLANEGLDDYQQYATQSASYENKQEKGANFVTASVSAKNKLMLTFYFNNITTDMTAYVSYTDHYGNNETLEIPGKEFVPRGNMYGVDVTGLAIADGRQLVTCVIKDSNGNEIARGVDSVESYCARATAANLGEVFDLLMRFVDSARNYF